MTAGTWRPGFQQLLPQGNALLRFRRATEGVGAPRPRGPREASLAPHPFCSARRQGPARGLGAGGGPGERMPALRGRGARGRGRTQAGGPPARALPASAWNYFPGARSGCGPEGGCTRRPRAVPSPPRAPGAAAAAPPGTPAPPRGRGRQQARAPPERTAAHAPAGRPTSARPAPRPAAQAVASHWPHEA